MIIIFLLISALLRRLGSVVLKLFHVLFMVRALLDSSPDRYGKANTSKDNFIQKWGSAARNCNFPKGKQQSSGPSATSKEHHNRSKSAPWRGRSAVFGTEEWVHVGCILAFFGQCLVRRSAVIGTFFHKCCFFLKPTRAL